MENLFTVLLILVGLINFAPLVGILSANKLNSAYGLSLQNKNEDQNLVVLLRHRALLFGIVGGFILYSAWASQYQTAALIMAAVSMLGYLLILWQEGGYNAQLKKVGVIDIIGLLLLAAAIAIKCCVLTQG